MYAQRAALLGGRTWSPSALGASLLAFWDAEQPSTLTLSGSNVTTWADAKNGYAPTQSTSGFKPVWSDTSFNSRPGITFDGTDDYLNLESMPFPTGTPAYEIWTLSDWTLSASDTANRPIFAFGGITPSRGLAQIRRVVTTGVNRVAATNNGDNNASDTSVDYFGKHVVRGQFAAATISVSVDGGSATSTGSTGTGVAATRVRSGTGLNDIPSSFAKCIINCTLVTSALSAGDAALLTAYLKTRGGIA